MVYSKIDEGVLAVLRIHRVKAGICFEGRVRFTELR